MSPLLSVVVPFYNVAGYLGDCLESVARQTLHDLEVVMVDDGSADDGLRTNVFPHAIATGNIHIGTIAGKLNGVIPAATPSGCRIE